MNSHFSIPSKKIPGAIIIEGHVQGLAIVRSLAEINIQIIVVDTSTCIAKVSKYCNSFFKCPNFQSDDFAYFLINLAQRRGLQDWVLFPSNDHAVYTISKFRKELEVYYKIITPPLSIIEKIYDKAHLIKIAQENQIPVPHTQTFYSEYDPIEKGLNFPMLIKGRNGLSFYKALGSKVLIANNEKELRDHLNIVKSKYALAGIISQELIPDYENDKTISFTAFCEEGIIRNHWTGIKLREHPYKFGTATFAKSSFNEECLRQSIDLIEALHYTGVCEIEYLKDPRSGEYKLIEINPRTWLWVGLAVDCGVDYPKLIFNHFYPLRDHSFHPYSETRYWINPVTDVVFSFANIMKGKLKLREYLFSLRKKPMTNALVNKKDFLPGLIYILLSMKFLRQR